MAASNTFQSYGSVTKTLHWLTVLLMFTVFPLGMIGEELSHTIMSAGSNVTEAMVYKALYVFTIHKTLGVTIFFVALARILWALTQPKPGLLNADNRLEAWLAETVHWMLYGALVLVPLSGWFHHAATSGYAPIWWPFGQSLPFIPKDPNVAEFFGTLHGVFTKILLLSVVLHIAGALKHHVIDRDATLRRMLPGRADAPQPPEQSHNLLPALTALAGWLAAIILGTVLWLGGDDHSDAAQSTDLEAVVSGWQVDSGTLAISIRQMGSDVSGEFADWTAAIQFDDPSGPGPAGHVNVTVAISSLTLGTVTSQAMGADFLDAEGFSTAEYDADLVKTADGYEAQGTLTLKGIAAPLNIPFELSIDGDTATATGTADILRLDHGVGASMSDESSLGFAVNVRFDLVATRNPD